MKTFKVTLVDFSNPQDSITREVNAENYHQAMRSAQADNEGYMAVEAEAILAPKAADKRHHPVEVVRIPAMAG